MSPLASWLWVLTGFAIVILAVAESRPSRPPRKETRWPVNPIHRWRR